MPGMLTGGSLVTHAGVTSAKGLDQGWPSALPDGWLVSPARIASADLRFGGQTAFEYCLGSRDDCLTGQIR